MFLFIPAQLLARDEAVVIGEGVSPDAAPDLGE